MTTFSVMVGRAGDAAPGEGVAMVRFWEVSQEVAEQVTALMIGPGDELIGGEAELSKVPYVQL